MKTTGITKSIEKTNKNKKTKISEPMGNQNHRENQKEIRCQDQWFWFTIIDTDILFLFVFSIACYPLVMKYWFSYLFGFLDGFGYPLVLKYCLFLLFWFSLWFCLSQSSSHLCRFGFLHGFTNNFCDQSCSKLHPIYLFISQLSSHLDAFGFHWFY